MRRDLVERAMAGENSITIVRADGGGASVIKAAGLTQVANPIWRPDGRRLTFRGEDTANTWGIYIVKPDGSDLVRLALDPGFDQDENYAADRDNYFQSPAWSPNGSTLAFHTLEPDPTSPAGPGFRIHLADVSEAGDVSNERILESKRSNDDEFAPSWLPQGDGLVFETLDDNEYRLWTGKIAPGSGPARDLGVTAADYISMVVSPDGRSIVASIPTGSSVPDVRLIDLETLDRTELDPAMDYVAWQRVAQ